MIEHLEKEIEEIRKKINNHPSTEQWLWLRGKLQGYQEILKKIKSEGGEQNAKKMG
jgi:hypothetical protein